VSVEYVASKYGGAGCVVLAAVSHEVVAEDEQTIGHIVV
jgi:hypothetical protein